MAALTTAIDACAPDCVLTLNVGYPGTLAFLRTRFGSSLLFDSSGWTALAAHAGTRKLVVCEAARNPDAQLVDLDDVVSRANAVGATVIVDATLLTPVLCRLVTDDCVLRFLIIIGRCCMEQRPLYIRRPSI